METESYNKLKELNEYFEHLYKFIINVIPNLDEYVYSINALFKFTLNEIIDFVINKPIPYYDTYYGFYDRINIIDKLELINEFYQRKKIKFNINEIIANGTINIEVFNLDDFVPQRSTYGYDQNGNKTINTFDYELLYSTIAWVHEIAHHRNLQDIITKEVQWLLTESISYVYEYLYIDFLIEKGYKGATEAYLFEKINNRLGSDLEFSPILTLFNLYCQLGEVSKENFEMYNSNLNNQYEQIICKKICYPDNFTSLVEESLKYIYKIEQRYEEYEVIFANGISYSLATPLSMYMYSKCLEKGEFINKIEKMNELINEKSFEECIEYIGLNYPFDVNSMEQVRNSTIKCLKRATQVFEKYKIL